MFVGGLYFILYLLFHNPLSDYGTEAVICSFIIDLLLLTNIHHTIYFKGFYAFQSDFFATFYNNI